jgi:uncharacterized protein with von Willebrand factor type A (vWA) domain
MFKENRVDSRHAAISLLLQLFVALLPLLFWLQPAIDQRWSTKDD